jgi:hypothetical protein
MTVETLDKRDNPPVYGLLAEFRSPQALLDAVDKAQAEGYSRMDAFTPYPVEAVSEAIEHHKRSRVPLLVLCGGLTGACVGFGLQLWAASTAYPMNIGGRPLNSWPAFIPVTFELTVLFAAFSAVFGMIILNRLPQPYHPVFNVERFERATQDGFFLLLEAEDPRFDLPATRAFLQGLGADEVHDVES